MTGRAGRTCATTAFGFFTAQGCHQRVHEFTDYAPI